MLPIDIFLQSEIILSTLPFALTLAFLNPLLDGHRSRESILTQILSKGDTHVLQSHSDQNFIKTFSTKYSKNKEVRLNNKQNHKKNVLRQRKNVHFPLHYQTRTGWKIGRFALLHACSVTVKRKITTWVKLVKVLPTDDKR